MQLEADTSNLILVCIKQTGVVGAVYRFQHDNWNLEQALAEMDQYEFGSGYGHGKQRDFVKEYWDQFQSKQTAAAATNR